MSLNSIWTRRRGRNSRGVRAVILTDIISGRESSILILLCVNCEPRYLLIYLVAISQPYTGSDIPSDQYKYAKIMKLKERSVITTYACRFIRDEPSFLATITKTSPAHERFIQSERPPPTEVFLYLQTRSSESFSHRQARKRISR